MAATLGCFRRLLLMATVCSLASPHVPRALAAPGDLNKNIGGFSTGGKIKNLGFEVRDMVIDRQGRIVLAGFLNGQFHVQRRGRSRFPTVENVPIVFPDAQSEAVAVTIGLDDRIVVAGTVTHNGGGRDFGVARLTPELELDPTFGDGGLVVMDLDGNPDRAYAVAVQTDSKVIVAGEIERSADESDWGVARFEQDGDPDNTFDGNGKRAFGYNHALDRATAIVLQGNKIVLAGTRDHDFGLARLETDGTLDETFGSLGDTQIDFNFNDRVHDMAVAPDGKLVVAGTSDDVTTFAIARFSSDGFPDDDFGSGGKVETPGPGVLTSCSGVDVQPDGKIVATGRKSLVGTLTIRYGTDGQLDPTFGDGGKILDSSESSTGFAVVSELDGTTVIAAGNYLAGFRWDGSLDDGGVARVVFDQDHEGSEVTALAIDTFGRLVAVGKAFVNDYEVAMARFHQALIAGLDTGFGNTNPKTGLTLFGSSGRSEELRSAVVEADGDVIAAGQINSDDDASDFLVARVKIDGTPDPACSADGLGSGDFSGLEDVGVAVAQGPSSKIYAAGTTLKLNSANDYGFMQFTSSCTQDNLGDERDPIELSVNVGGDDVAAGMVVQSPSGRRVIAGSSGGNIVLTRIRNKALTGEPELDTTFGVSGKATLDTGGIETAAGLAQQSDGSLIVAGTVTTGASSNFLVARFTAGGVLDTNFGVGGVGLADFHTVDTAHALAVRSDDTIAVAGTTNATSGIQFAVAQFEPGGFLDPEFASLSGKATARLGGAGEDVAQAVAFLGNSDLVLGGYSTVYGIRQFALVAFQTSTLVPTTTTTTTTLPGNDCGDPASPSGSVTASDALFVLKAAVGTNTCALCVCDVNDNGALAASDALVTLRVAVGQDADLMCPACL